MLLLLLSCHSLTIPSFISIFTSGHCCVSSLCFPSEVGANRGLSLYGLVRVCGLWVLLLTIALSGRCFQTLLLTDADEGKQEADRKLVLETNCLTQQKWLFSTHNDILVSLSFSFCAYLWRTICIMQSERCVLTCYGT